MRVLVTDADYKHTLGAVRSLGRAGEDVLACSSHPHALAFYSRLFEAVRVPGSPSGGGVAPGP